MYGRSDTITDAILIKINHQIDANPDHPLQRGYSEINKKRYMKIYVEDGVQPGEQIRLLLRRFEKEKPGAFDIMQIGYLQKGEKLELSHGGGNFLPEHPFWFDRKKYLMSMRIVHWIYEKKIEVMRKFYNSTHSKAIGIFQEPVQFFYTGLGYYTELVYTMGYANRIVDHVHYLYVQGEVLYKFDNFKIPQDFYGGRTSETFKDTVSLQNTIEAYRSYVDKPGWQHGDTDQLVLESMGSPMPYHATFGPGGFYMRQRAYFAGFFTNDIVVEIKTDFSTYIFRLSKNSIKHGNVTVNTKRDLYHSKMFERRNSISLINAGESLLILYNVPHRYDIMRTHETMFATEAVQFSVKWDGPIREMIFSDSLRSQKPEKTMQVDPVYQSITLLQHVDIDNELML